ncbi:MAG TPA: AAA family ATPase [Mucilaginibacter sp.]|nr:AAA family ATPase [Mucilaginibacter sp.]
MKIKSISITNVKSFRSATKIEFDQAFNIIVGPNAAGKSNLLDILSICLRGYFLTTYNIRNDRNSPGVDIAHPFQNLPLLLDKYTGCTNASLIELEFSVQAEDLINMKLFGQFRVGVFYSLQIPDNDSKFSDFKRIGWDQSILQVGDVLNYRIENGVLKAESPVYLQNNNLDAETLLVKTKAWIFLKYLNHLHLFELAGIHFPNAVIHPPFLFLSSYRGTGNDNDFQGNLSSQSAYSAASQIRNRTSKSMTSLINMATLYFSEKRRKMETEAHSIGYEILWQNDSEVKLVTRYLDRLGYGWSMQLIDPLKNIYEIRLIKQGYELTLSQASSGEKEIINYLFGIFALKITNGLIVIDEPELHLHPRWQLLLMDLFMELTRQTKNQFLITTHSPVFINVNSVSNLIRVYRENRESYHVPLKDLSSGSVKDLLHIVNSTNNEKIFFADHVILVEGLTDRLVFQKIVSILMERHQILSVVEVVEINGKGNIKKFRQYLKKLHIPYYFIADLDYINQVGTTELKALFTTDLGAVDNNAIKNPKSTDGDKLITVLDDAIANKDMTALKAFSEYIKSFRRKLKDTLTYEERTVLDNFIASRCSNNEYILNRGDIERYFPEGYSAKDLDKVLELLQSSTLKKWQQSDGYKELEAIVINIFRRTELIINP